MEALSWYWRMQNEADNRAAVQASGWHVDGGRSYSKEGLFESLFMHCTDRNVTILADTCIWKLILTKIIIEEYRVFSIDVVL